MDSPEDGIRLGDGITIWCKKGNDQAGVWKREVLTDFEQWLNDLPEELGEEEPAQVCDLHALFSALTSLRQEMRLQNREQARTARELEQAVEASKTAEALFSSCSEGLEHLETQVRVATERRCMLPFLDMRDALSRGHEAAVQVAGVQGLFRRAPEGMDGVVQGYEMAIERFDRALALVGVSRVETVGWRFDPQTMQALEVRHVTGVDNDVVIEELLSGFVRGEEVVRVADVVVNRIGTLER